MTEEVGESGAPFDNCPDCGSEYDKPCPGTVRPVRACDWKPPLHGIPSNPNDLLSDDEKERLNASLQRMSEQRRRAEANSAHIVLGGADIGGPT